MKFCILMGSPRKKGNTAALLNPFIQELKLQDIQHDMIWLQDKQIAPCIACRTCQKDWTGFGCHYQDDVQEIFDKVYNCDLIILATPIYCWYCTAPMKAMLDRLMYGMNKFYGDERGPSLWAGKKVAIITSCGYSPEKGADLFEEGIKRYCKHSQLQYIGILAERDYGYNTSFMTDEKEEHVRLFANDLIKSMRVL